MLSRLVRLALLAEILLYGAIGIWLIRAQGWSVTATFFAAVAMALAVRLVFVVASFAIGSRAASPGTVLREFRSVLGSNFLGVPFPHLVTPKEIEAAPTDRIPVVLVHGYFGNRGFWGALLRWLEGRGIGPVFAPDFPATFATIEDFAQALEREIERISTATGQPRVILVCHSMGGLATRRYLANRGAARIAKVITIASPHAGTVLSRFGMGANAAQMRRDSAFLAELRRAENGRAPCPFTSIYSIHDNMVTPQDTSRLEWARNVPLEGVGHITIIQSPATFAALAEELRG